jgi:hypothetical protein
MCNVIKIWLVWKLTTVFQTNSRSSFSLGEYIGINNNTRWFVEQVWDIKRKLILNLKNIGTNTVYSTIFTSRKRTTKSPTKCTSLKKDTRALSKRQDITQQPGGYFTEVDNEVLWPPGSLQILINTVFSNRREPGNLHRLFVSPALCIHFLPYLISPSINQCYETYLVQLSWISEKGLLFLLHV